MSVLAPREGYRLWAPTYSAETVVTALEDQLFGSLGGSVAGSRLLDAACGTGRRLRAAQSAGPALSIGIDLTPEMLPKSDHHQHYAAADVRALPFRAGGFTMVWCRLALGHIPQLDVAYRELARVCSIGGRVLTTDFHSTAARAGHRRTFRDASGDVHEIEHHVHTLDSHIHAADGAGLTMTAHGEGVVGPFVRDFYERTGRMSSYSADLGMPLVLGVAFSKRES